jgi:hypothetical protein
MSSSGSSSSSSGAGLCSLLTVLFVGLKLTGYIDWPWIWVLAPTWIPVAIVATIFAVIALLVIAEHILDRN